MPRHKRKKRAGATKATPGVKRTDWLVGDLVVAKLRGHRPWPAQIQKPEDFGYEARPHRIFITFFGTDETCFCSYNKITPFTGAVRKSFAEQLQKINTNQELERAIKEIFAADDELKMSMRSTHGSSRHKEDEADIMGEGSEKSEEEKQQQQQQRSRQQPAVFEKTRKRARGVDEEGVADVAEEIRRPAKQEKTAVKNMAIEQVQKLPRKVRIKVSSQSSDSPRSNHQQAAAGEGDGGDGEALPAASEKASMSSSEAPSTEISPNPTSKNSAVAVISNEADKNGDEPTSGKEADTTSMKRADNVMAKVSEVVVKHNTENGVDVKDNVDKVEKDDKMEVDAEASSIGKEAPPVAPKGVDDAESGLEKMEVDDAVLQKTDAATAAAKPTAERAIGSTDSNKPVVVPVIGVDSTKAGEEDSSRAGRQQCETAQPILKADALEERQAEGGRLQVTAGTKEDEACPPSSNPVRQTDSKAEADGGSGLEGRDPVSTKAEPGAGEEATTTKDRPVKVPVTPSPLGVTTASEVKEDAKMKQDAEPEAVSGSAVHDAATAERVSMSGVPTEGPPSKDQDSTSSAQPEIAPASVPVSGQVTASKTTDEKVPSSETTSLSKGQGIISGAQPETGPASARVSGQVTGSEKTDEKVAISVKEAVPAIVAHEVSGSTKQNGTVSASVEEQGPVAAAKDEVLLSTSVKEDSVSGAPNDKERSGPVSKDEPVLPASVKEASVSGAETQKEGSLSVSKDNPLPSSSDKDAAESGAQDKKEGPGPAPKNAAAQAPLVKEVAVSAPQDQKEGSGTASKDEALVPPAGEEVSVSFVSGAQEEKEGTTSSVPVKEQLSENTLKSETVPPKSEKDQVSVAPAIQVETASAAAKE